MSDAQELAAKLLEAHVAQQLQQLQGPALATFLDAEVAALFAWLTDVKLDDVATRAQIIGVIERFVIELKLSGTLTELSGEMSRLVLTSPLSEHTRVDQVLTPESFTQFADKLAGLDSLWRELIHLVAQSDAYATLLSRMVQRGLLDAVFRDEHRSAQRSLLDGLLGKLRPLIEQRVEPYVSAYLEAFIKQIARRGERRLVVALDPEAMRGVVDEVWDAIAPMRLSDAFAYISSHDLEDFVVLGYEFWLKYRKTSYYREISAQLVDHFFDKYGDDSLLNLLDELGVSAEMVSHELQTFLGPLLAHATVTGYLETRIRSHLLQFYQSDALLAILAARS
jgi:hypothetical protein